jgi:hypothetical protein
VLTDYLDKERREAARRDATRIMSFIGKRKTPKFEKMTPLVEKKFEN